MEKRIQFDNHMGEALSGTLQLPDAPGRFGVVLLHCFTCSRHTSILRQIAQDLKAAGMASLRFDFSGNGQSEGRFTDSTYSKMLVEVDLAVKRLSGEGVARIGLAGHSMGASLAVLAAQRSEKIVAVCAMAGRLSGTNARHILSPAQQAAIKDTGRVCFMSRGRDLELTESFFSDADAFDLPEMLKTLRVPLLVVHGDEDETVPVSEAYRAEALNPANTRLAIMPGADHMFSSGEDRTTISRTVADWFRVQNNRHS